MEDDNITLDQIIKIINFQKKLPPINQLKQSNNGNNTSIQIPKTLLFKPWSGKISIDKQSSSQHNQQWCIQQQIEGQQQQPQNYNQADPHYSELAETNDKNENQYLYKFHSGYVRLIKYLLEENGFKDAHAKKNWSIYWSSSAVKMEQYHSLLPYQKINHFPNSFYITRKDLMNKCISKMQLKFGYTNFNFLPKTFILPQQMDQLIEESTKLHPVYIVKPHNRSQGKGITVTDSLSVIESKLQKYSSLIVSHYVDNPLLINKLKFDLRIYVGITGVNPLRIYVYEQGLARFATEQYDSTIEQPQGKRFQHLTNYSVNKKNTEFVPSNNQEYFGSKWSLTSLKDFLNFNIGKQQTTDLFQRIDEVIIKTIISVQNILYNSFMSNVPYINNCFQVLGFDILIDSNLKPWLMEVNLSPSLNTDSQLDLKIKGNMIAQMLTMIGVTPLDQRYVDGSNTRFQTHFYNRDQRQIQKGAIDRFLLKQIQAQHSRRGDWRRVFPTINHRYKNYFQTDRYFNKLLRQSILDSKNTNYQYRSNTVQQNKHYIKKPNVKIRIGKSRNRKSFFV